MKHFFLLILLSCSAGAFAQKMVPFQLGNDFTLDLPGEVTGMEIEGDSMYTATTDNTLFMVTRYENDPDINDTKVTDEQSLTQLYKTSAMGLLLGLGGKHVSDTVFERNGLKWGSLVCMTEENGDAQQWICDLLYVNKTMYILYMCETGTDAALMEKEREAVRASIQTPEGLAIADQFNALPEPFMPKLPETSSGSSSNLGRSAIRIVIPLVLLLVGLGTRAARNRKNREEQGF